MPPEPGRPARIALVHAVTVAMAPVRAAFEAHWPVAEQVNLLDDSLSPDRARDGALTEAMGERIAALGRYALSLGAQGILYTCSAFGPAIERFAQGRPEPVLKPNEAMFDAALEAGEAIGMLATFAPSVETMEPEFRAAAALRRPGARLTTVLVEGALDALKAGDAERHNALLAAAAPRLAGCDAILLAHFSTARARDAVRAAVEAPVYTSPDAAVLALRERLGAPAATNGG